MARPAPAPTACIHPRTSSTARASRSPASLRQAPARVAPLSARARPPRLSSRLGGGLHRGSSRVTEAPTASSAKPPPASEAAAPTLRQRSPAQHRACRRLRRASSGASSCSVLRAQAGFASKSSNVIRGAPWGKLGGNALGRAGVGRTWTVIICPRISGWTWFRH